jgi:hypothetical protein
MGGHWSLSVQLDIKALHPHHSGSNEFVRATSDTELIFGDLFFARLRRSERFFVIAAFPREDDLKDEI